MTLKKAIEHGKEHRKTYREKGRRAAEYCYSCRNGGSCGYCRNNRLFSYYKTQQLILEEMLLAKYDPTIDQYKYYDARSDLDNYEQEVLNSLTSKQLGEYIDRSRS